MSSGFISENEIAERKRVRQEEWDKVRQADQPAEAPEEEYDPRSLYERLQAQKQKRDLEYEEAHRLKNMIKGLDDDEVEFLDLVDRSKLEEERKKTLEDAREMAEFRSKVACLQEESIAERIQMEIKKPQLPGLKNNSRSSQSKLLAGVVVKKRPCDTQDDSSPLKKLKASEEPQDICNTDRTGSHPDSHEKVSDPESKLPESSYKCSEQVKVGAMTCIGVLPGLGHYRNESSDEVDSDDSSDVNEPDSASPVKFDLVGRKIEKKHSNSTE